MSDKDQQIRNLENENTYLRGRLAASGEVCLYCNLTKERMAECRHGFPGCARADDLSAYYDRIKETE